MEFEWDETKRRVNLVKHGIDFLRAATLFDGRPITTEVSVRNDEHRWKTTGVTGQKYITMVWTWREGKVRIISARSARHAEKRAYRALYGGAN